jgi:hypothetical protein
MMYDVFGKLVLNIRKLIKAVTGDEAVEKVKHQLHIDMWDRVEGLVVRDIKGNIHIIDIDEAVELEWINAEENFDEE